MLEESFMDTLGTLDRQKEKVMVLDQFKPEHSLEAKK